MANKRIKKKQQKLQQNKKMVSFGLPEKQIKRMTPTDRKKQISKINRTENKQRLRNEKKQFLNNNGISNNVSFNGKIYSPSQLLDLSYDNLRKIAKNEHKRQQTKARQDKKYQKMLNSGLPEHLAHKYKSKSYKYVDEAIFKGDRTIYKAKESLSVLWADVTGESHYDLALAEFDNLSTNEMIDRINEEYETAKTGKSPRGKNYFLGVAKIEISADKDKLVTSAKKSYKKGYKNGAVAEDGHFLTSNKFTVRGYANMMLSVMTRAKPEHIEDYYAKFETYAFENLPEIHKQIFK